MSLSARHAALILLVPFASLLAQTGTLPPALASLRARADAGDALSQYNLGVAYAKGREIPADPIEAYVWLSLAAEHGTPGKDYETLLQEITPAQLAEGKRRLGLRKNAVAVGGPAAASPITLAPLDAPDRTAELAAKNQQLTAEIARLHTELDAANASAGRAIVGAKSDANAIADALSAKLNALTTQLNAANAESAQLQATAKAADAAQAQLTREKTSLAQSVASLTAEKNALAAKLEQASAAPKTDPAAPRLAALETELATAKAELTRTQTKLSVAEGLEPDLARSLEQTHVLQTQLASLTADRDALKNQLAESSRAAATKAPDHSAPQIAALTAQVASLTAAKTSVEQKLASAEARLIAPLAPAKNEELTAANAKLETVLRSFTLAQNENTQLKSAANAAKSESATLRQQLADAQSKLSAVPVAAPAKNEELTAANAKLETTLRSFTLAQNENAQLKSAAEAAKSESATLRQQLADAQSKLSAVPVAAPAKNEELTAANAKLETVLRSFTLAQNENAQLKSAADAAKSESATLRQQLADAQSKIVPAGPATADPVALQKQLKDTETKLSVALRSYVVIAAENDKLKSDVGARTNSSAQAIAAAEARASAAAALQAYQLAEVRDQLRQVQSQSAAYAEENFQLRTRLASGGNSTAAPTRASERLVVTPFPANEPALPAPVPVPETRTHKIVIGDTLLGLAKKYYGEPARWTEILAANNDVLGGKPTLPLGRTLRIP